MKKLIGILMLAVFTVVTISGLIISAGLEGLIVIIITVIGAAWVIAAFYLIAGDNEWNE